VAERHLVQQGESVSSLAERYGHDPDTLWDHPQNAGLRAIRSRRDALAPGDELFIPDVRIKNLPCAVGRRHVFRRNGVPAFIEIQLFDVFGRPRRNRPYTLEVDGTVYDGTTDDQGRLRRCVPNAARRGRLVIEGELDQELLFGHLDPIETVSGVRKRLSNLGLLLPQGTVDIDAATAAALARFQSFCGLPSSGEIDDATREALRACHDDGHLRNLIAVRREP
jgi:hypothetical protein